MLVRVYGPGPNRRRHPSVGQVNNARLALVGDAVLDVCALSDVYDAAPEVGALSVEGARRSPCNPASCLVLVHTVMLLLTRHKCGMPVRGGSCQCSVNFGQLQLP